MTNLKSILIKQFFSKFKVSYFCSLLLFLSLTSCTKEEVMEAFLAFIVLIMIGIVVYGISIVFFILLIRHIIQLVFYKNESNKNVGDDLLDSESIEKSIPISQRHEGRNPGAFIEGYFWRGLIPLFIFFVAVMILKSMNIASTTEALGTFLLMFLFHGMSSYILFIIGNKPPRLITKEMSIKAGPKKLLSRMQGHTAFLSYNISVLKNELILHPKQSHAGRVIVIQCLSKSEDKYFYLVESSVRPINNAGFNKNQQLINIIIGLEW